jgi:hypothetical protein
MEWATFRATFSQTHLVTLLDVNFNSPVNCRACHEKLTSGYLSGWPDEFVKKVAQLNPTSSFVKMDTMLLPSVEKRSRKICAVSVGSGKSPYANNRPIGNNSPNLFTLPPFTTHCVCFTEVPTNIVTLRKQSKIVTKILTKPVSVGMPCGYISQKLG